MPRIAVRSFSGWLGLPAVLCLVASFSAAAARWERLGPDGGRIAALVAAPTDPRIVYAGGVAVFRSSDGGAHWTRATDVFPTYGPEAPPPLITALAVHPKDPNRVLAASPQGLFLTTNGGVAWRRAGTVSAAIVSVTFNTDGRRAFASGANTLFRSLDNGDTWTSTPLPTFRALCADPQNAAGLLGARAAPDASGRTLYRTDNGTAWTPLNAPGPDAVALCPAPSGDLFFAAVPGEAGGVFRFGRNGENLTAVSNVPTVALAAPAPGWLYTASDAGHTTIPAQRTTDNGTTWDALRTGFGGRGPLCVAVGPEQLPLLGTERGGVMAANLSDIWHVSNAGLRMTDIGGVWRNPRSGAILAATGDGLYRTADEGDHWVLGQASVAVSVMAGSPARPGRVFHTGADGLRRSDDDGRTWTGFHSGLPANAAIARLAPHPSDDDTLYAVLANGAVYRNTTSVASWKNILPAMTPAPAAAPDLAIAPSRPATLYALRADGLHRSENGGNSWALRSAVPAPRALLAVHPVQPETVVRVVSAPPVVTVFRSTDGGATWTSVRREDGGPNSGLAATFLVFDARASGRALLGTNRGLRISEDGGLTWRVEAIGTGATFCGSWAPYGAAGDLLGTLGVGVVRGRPETKAAVSAADALAVLHMALSNVPPTPDQTAMGDLNDDGQVTAQDADLALRAATGP